DRSPLALKKELETNIFPKSLGGSSGFFVLAEVAVIVAVLRGHEREDVQEYRKKWVIRMMNYQKKMEQYDGDEMENVIPPERLEIWNMRHVLVTHDEVYFYTNDDNSSFWVEDKESIIKKKAKEADATRLGLDQEARVIIKPGQQADGSVQIHENDDSGRLKYVDWSKIGLSKKGGRQKG
ncbi:15166_t:CDS:2, partial [Gigaspora margarita]